MSVIKGGKGMRGYSAQRKKGMVPYRHAARSQRKGGQLQEKADSPGRR